MKGKRIIIIGAGLLQVPAIQIAQEMGLYTIVFDYNKDAHGMKIADYPMVVSTRDVDGSVRAARDLSQKMEIHGVITVGTDASSTVAAVANALGLPGNRFEDAYAASNKIRMRERFKKNNVPQPNFFPVWNYEEAMEAYKHLNTPVVVKPADNMGARGVMKVSSESDILAAFNRAKSASPSGEVIVEEFMDGPELSIDMLIYNDEIYVTGVADRIIEFPPFFIETGHIMPSALEKEKIDDAINVMKAGIKALNLKIGAAKGDIKVTKNGAMVGEIAARLSGGFMSAYTYPLSTGVNLIKNAIEIALGNPPSDLKPKWDKVSVEKAFLPGTGIIESIEGVENAKKIEGVKEVFIKTKTGDILVTPTNNLEKAGNVITVGKTRDEAVAIANKAINAVHFKLTDEKSITVEEIKRIAQEKLASKHNADYLFEDNIDEKTGLSNYSFNPSIIHEEKEVKLETTLFNTHVSQPVIIDTIHNLTEVIDGIMDIREYYETVMDSASNCEVLAILNDFNNEELFELSVKTVKDKKRGIIMIDGNNTQDVLLQRLRESEKNGACAVGIDFSYCYNINSNNKIHIRSEKELSKLIKEIDIPVIIKGISNENDIHHINSAHANAVYFSNNNRYALKGMEKVADTINRVACNLHNSHKMQLLWLTESPRYGADVFKYFMLGANAVSITEESFISAISKGRKGLEYAIYSNKIELEKMMKVFAQPKLKFNNAIWRKN
ncbi:alpha-hydroxy-acid oxidizing protein [Brachyspira hampsonii]|uniref:alpha-hydroxy-acid oxidizing protein n=1 Tax=Brachyspira hampsonii TaxID=1287055 RepID=UPI000D37FE19|nr:alpha-hydroxy-acid oxidizing protein [Brachyspira hampsonii]PTY40549.1 lactate dehydrogenase [Brachyspira hampsonii bv. II]